MSNSFISLDFETANSARASACQIGLARFEGGSVVDTYTTLLKPHKDLRRFDPINTSIHGIGESDVGNAPEFDEVWGEIQSFIDNSHLVAHNAGFDMSVLRGLLDLYGLEFPKMNYYCTLMLSRNLLKPAELNLKHVANILEVEITNHHDALADAVAAGNIAASLVRRFEAADLVELGELARIRPGTFSESGWRGSATRATNAGSASETLEEMISRLADSIGSERPLNGITFVITGTLPGMSRNEAHEMIVLAGGAWATAVTKKTDYLVDAERTGETNKTRKVYELREKGVDIAILDAEGFFGLISP